MARVGAEVSLRRDLEPPARGVLAALVLDRVAPPVELDARHLDREEDDDGRDGDTARERGAEDKVVLGPEGEVLLLEPEPRDRGDVDGRRHVGQVVPDVNGGLRHGDGLRLTEHRTDLRR